ncbi:MULTISPECIES: VOC family protein [Leeuwenhoekiella]|uniref:VOC family protein n=1 Tax=Leeuwenhoekiella TaxID=283735 RepID=UPI000C4393EA|nr:MULTISPECIES: VOC family protein [Leeuwenhoekiella]MAO43094.1 glyoxalase [Leeuwenhoekiella sp.]MAO45426.1 glyoxalase [Leeuwenhoekiella sp.]|tara:strand:+ start:144 stop:509 length:366 start_codon:yes stop_codon:yes gene_type:complete
MNDLIAWFEIPVKNLDRAKNFYEAILDIEMTKVEFGGFKMGWFPKPKVGASGSLVEHEAYNPSKEGTLIYLAAEDVSIPLAKIENAGGTILQGKTQISEEHGFMAVFLDTEGNRIALHSLK